MSPEPARGSAGSLAARSPDVRPRGPGGPVVDAVLRVIGVSLVLGGMTAFAQASLPFVLSPWANSAGTWSLAAFALTWWFARSALSSMLSGAASLAALLAGYVVTDELRGFPAGLALMLFWGVAAVVVGPVLGLGAWWLRSRRDALAALGAASIGGVLIGEGISSLLTIADTTPPTYWWGSIGVGVALLLTAARARLRGARAYATAALATAALAAAYVVLTGFGGSLLGKIPN